MIIVELLVLQQFLWYWKFCIFISPFQLQISLGSTCLALSWACCLMFTAWQVSSQLVRHSTYNILDLHMSCKQANIYTHMCIPQWFSVCNKVARSLIAKGMQYSMLCKLYRDIYVWKNIRFNIQSFVYVKFRLNCSCI